MAPSASRGSWERSYRDEFRGLDAVSTLVRLPGQEFADVLEEPKEVEGLEPTGIVSNIVSR